jgi:hypothetical protein
VSYSRRLEAVIAAKDASTKYCVKGLNTYVKVVFTFYIFYTFANKYKNLFLLGHYGIYCVDLRVNVLFIFNAVT